MLILERNQRWCISPREKRREEVEEERWKRGRRGGRREKRSKTKRRGGRGEKVEERPFRAVFGHRIKPMDNLDRLSLAGFPRCAGTVRGNAIPLRSRPARSRKLDRDQLTPL